MMTAPLPEELDRQFWRELRDYEEAQRMPYISSVERMAIREGREQGLQEGRRSGLLALLDQFLELKFGAAGQALYVEIERIEDVAVLDAVVERLKTATTPDDVRRVYQSN